MTDMAEEGSGAVDGAPWWYRDGARAAGPVSASELRRLAQGTLGPATLVWNKAFGDGWRRLDRAFCAADGPQPPDGGRWSTDFEAFRADPDARRWSWLGLLAMPAYLCLGMWRRALVMLSFVLASQLALVLADVPPGSRLRLAPAVALVSFCVRNLKRDLFRHRMLGETMWRPLAFMARPWACGGLAAVLLVALVAASAPPTSDGAMVAELAGVWQDDGLDVVADVGGARKTITCDGRTVDVRLAAVDEVRETVVFADAADPRHTFTFQRNWNAGHDEYTMALLVDDRLKGQLLFVRPL